MDQKRVHSILEAVWSTMKEGFPAAAESVKRSMDSSLNEQMEVLTKAERLHGISANQHRIIALSKIAISRQEREDEFWEAVFRFHGLR